MSAAIRVILFDLGGVLVELNHQMQNLPWFDRSRSTTDNWHRWLSSPLSQEFEQGRLTPTQFAQRFIDSSGLDLDPAEFLEIFRDWVIGFYPGVFSLLDRLSVHYSIGVFSNTNAIHWPPLHAQLTHRGSVSYCFASYQMGLAKPDPAAFRHVATSMGVAPAEILFLDDNPTNVESARSSGFIAEQVSGFEQIPSVLHSYGIHFNDK